MNKMSNNTKSLTQPNKGIWSAIIICAAIVAGTFNSIFVYAAFAISLAAIVPLLLAGLWRPHGDRDDHDQ